VLGQKAGERKMECAREEGGREGSVCTVFPLPQACPLNHTVPPSDLLCRNSAVLGHEKNGTMNFGRGKNYRYLCHRLCCGKKKTFIFELQNTAYLSRNGRLAGNEDMEAELSQDCQGI
jgi:hypothetical protein